MSSRNHSVDDQSAYQKKLLYIQNELKKAQSIIIQQAHMLQIQKQLMDRKQSIDKVKNTLISNLRQENMSIRQQLTQKEQNICETKQSLEKLTLLNNSLKAANDQLLNEISKAQTVDQDKENRIQQIKRLSLIYAPPIPPPPPPPLPLKQQEQKIKVRPQPKRQMKQLHWEQIATIKIDKTFWNKIDDSLIILNFTQIEDLFYLQQQQQTQQPILEIPITPILKPVFSILNQERAKSVELVIVKYRLTSEAVKLAVQNIDLQYLDLEKIEALLKCLPTGKEAEQMEKVKDLTQIKLNIPEKFLFELYQLPFFEERLCSINFKIIFSEIQEQLEHKLALLEQLSIKLSQDQILQKMLSYALALGNFLNVSSTKGVYKGFKIDSIEKFTLIKANDRETSLLMYLIQITEEKGIEYETDQGLFFISQDVNEASKFSLIGLFNNEIHQIKQGLKNLEKIFSIENEKIQSTYSSFYSDVNVYSKNIESNYLNAQKSYEQLCDCYGESYQNYESDKIFAKFNLLYNNLKKAKQQCQQLKSIQEQQSALRETQTQLSKIRESVILNQMNEREQQVMLAKRMPLNELLKFKRALKSRAQTSKK